MEPLDALKQALEMGWPAIVLIMLIILWREYLAMYKDYLQFLKEHIRYLEVKIDPTLRAEPPRVD